MTKKRGHRPPWKPGDPCPHCKEPVYSRAEMYKASHNVCRPCGQKARRDYLDKQKAARPSERNCVECSAFISGLTTATRCASCVAKRRADGARKGTEAMMEKRRSERAIREATRGPVEAPRPAAQAYPGLRCKGGEWEKLEQVLASVPKWATLDGGRL
jgi:hypothetical protein